MEVFIIGKQSESDVITNSSSEVFIMNTDKSPEEIVNILRTFTYGFNPNIYRFNLEEYKKALADRNPDLYDERFGYATPFNVAQEEFVDKKDKLACAKVLVRNLWWEEDGIIKKFCDYIGHPYDPEMWSVTLVENISDYNINSENAEKVLKWFKDNKYLFEYGYCDLDNLKDLNDLDGKLMLFSENDNSIPYEDFEKIEELFNAKRIHLG